MNINELIVKYKELIDDIFNRNKPSFSLYDLKNILGFIYHNKKNKELELFSEEDILFFKKEINDHYFNWITSTDLINYLLPNEFKYYCNSYVPQEYLEHPMLIQSINKMLDLNEEDDERKKLSKLLSPSYSITQMIDLVYPSDTCPLIDDGKASIGVEIENLENQIRELQTFKSENEDEIEKLLEERDILVDNMENIEELREACSKMRELAQEITGDIKDSFKLSHDGELDIVQFKEINPISYYENKKIKIMPNMIFFNRDYFEDAIDNYEELSKLVDNILESYENETIKNKVLEYSKAINYDNYIEIFKKK